MKTVDSATATREELLEVIQAQTDSHEGRKMEIGRLRAALQAILGRAHSDASAEELEDAQADLRHIFDEANRALQR